MIKAFVAGTIRDYIPESERTLDVGEPKTIFKLRTLTAREAAEIDDSVSAFQREGMVYRKGSRQFLALKIGVAGVENFEKPYEKSESGRATDAFIDSIPPDIRTELATEILGYNGLTPEQEKN